MCYVETLVCLAGVSPWKGKQFWPLKPVSSWSNSCCCFLKTVWTCERLKKTENNKWTHCFNWQHVLDIHFIRHGNKGSMRQTDFPVKHLSGVKRQLSVYNMSIIIVTYNMLPYDGCVDWMGWKLVSETVFAPAVLDFLILKSRFWWHNCGWAWICMAASLVVASDDEASASWTSIHLWHVSLSTIISQTHYSVWWFNCVTKVPHLCLFLSLPMLLCVSIDACNYRSTIM